jgi:hypothetical protein
MLGEGIEIAVLVQEAMAVGDAVGRDDQVGRLADGDAKGSQVAVVRGSLSRESGREHAGDCKPTQPCLNGESLLIASGAAQDLKQNDVADQNVLRVLKLAQPVHRW